MTENGNHDIESSENDTDISPENIIGSIIDETPEEDTILSHQTSINLVPFIGQRFVSQDAAYEFYCTFAKQCGFSIRRHRTRGKDGVGRGVTRRDFTCHRGGFPQAKPTEDGRLQRNRKSSRCGCQAYMRIVKRADFDVPEWRVTAFSNTHNHELLKSTPQMCIVSDHCPISPDDKGRICMFAKAGMSVRQMLRLMELEKGVKLGCLPFTELDIRNLLQSFRHVDRDSDAIDVVGMCKKLKDVDPEFKYEFKLDGNNRLEHIAWSYSPSVQQYQAYGDAVVFDTTHRLDAYDMLLGLWIGVDNHGMVCLFGCVLLRDENLLSFSWALKTFQSFMSGKAPQTILTDQNMWLKEAIASELPKTKHAFCIWDIMANFSDWFSALLGPSYDDWKAEFYRLYGLETVEEFESRWKDMVSRYQLQSNKHVISLYALRNFWALSFLRSFFFVGLSTKSMSESINSFIQRILSAQSELECFIDKVGNIAEYNDPAGAKQKMQQKQHKATLKTGSPMESHAATILTPYAFSLLQHELLLAPQFASVLADDGCRCFLVTHHANVSESCRVTWDTCQQTIRCSCCQFEFVGILCRHILRVLSTNNCFQIPDQYLPARWRLVSGPPPPAKPHVEKVQILESLASSVVSEAAETEERLDIACEQMSMVLSHIKELPRLNDEPPGEMGSLMMEDSEGILQGYASLHDQCLSGKLKDRKPNAGAEIGMDECVRKRRRCCSIMPCCGQFGHDASDCPIIGTSGGLHEDGDPLGFL